METKHIKIANKIATYDENTEGVIVCDNSDYEIEFEFDSAWDAYPEKKAKFTVYHNGRYESVSVGLKGNKCPVPPFSDVSAVEVGVFVDNSISTTTPAVIKCLKSIHSRTSKSVFSVAEIERMNAALKGADGKTPQKGVDYFTEEDKVEIANLILANFVDVAEVGQ